MGPRAFFEQVRDAFDVAARNTGCTDVDIDLTGCPLRLSFASDVLRRRLSRALAHRTGIKDRPTPDRSPTRILVWDTASTGISPPPPPWGPHDYRQKGRIRGFNRDGIHTSFHLGPNVLSMFDDATRTGLFWTREGAALPDYQIGSPLLIILQWWAESEGLQLLHGGAVGTDQGGVLLVGAGGSGKSTTALSCVDTPGFSYVSDDYCLLRTSTEDRVHSLYCTAKLDARSLEILPHFEPLASNPERRPDEKAILYLHECRAEALVSSLPLKAIVLPAPAHSETASFAPARPAAALKALAPSTIFQLTGAGSHTFADMAALVKRLPGFELRLSTHMRDVPSTIGEIIQQVA